MSSRCQLSVIRPLRTRRMSVAMKSTAGRPLRAAMRQCVVHEILPDGAGEQRRAAIDPEAIEGIDGFEQRGKALGRDVVRHDLLPRPGHG